MSKIKIKMKLTGFELEIEGSRDDMPQISQALGRQLTGLLQPPDGVIDGIAHQPIVTLPAEEVKQEPSARKRPRKRVASANGTADQAEKDSTVNWRHDVATYGAPSQAWSTASKAIWTLYVVGKESQEKELTGRRLTLTFNKHFRQAKEINVPNVNRDLGRLKLRKPALVSEDTTKSPTAWYLTDEGVKHAETLISEALG